MSMHTSERYETVIIGAGQAGLSAGYHLKRRGRSFVILEARDRIGDVWRERWDSLRLFTPARFNGLDGMPFPGPGFTFPTKDEMAEYLAAYAARFELPVRTGVTVERVKRHGDGYIVYADGRRIEADNVVVAMATFQRPRVPAFAAELDGRIRQLHSAEYRNPAQLQDGSVLIVGAGNSGAEIGLEVARRGRVLVAGRDVGHIPFRTTGTASRLLLMRLVLRGLFHRVFTVSTPIGRKVRAKMLHIGGPLIRCRPGELAAAGIERVPRVTGVRGGLPVLADGSVLDVANIIWCTGFHPGFSWIDVPVFDDRGEPRHHRGVTQQPGLYFVGLHFLYAMSSTMIHGVGRDAEHIARHIDTRARRAPLAVRGAPRVHARAAG